MPKDTVLHSKDGEEFSPLKVTVAPNGARKTKRDHPNLPMTTDEVVRAAAACFDAGADEIHLHVREDTGEHSLDVGLYQETINALSKEVPQIEIQVTTEAAGRYSVSEQFALLKKLQPCSASVSVREIAREPEQARAFYRFARDADIHLQHILYDDADAQMYCEWQMQSILSEAQNDVLLVLGQYHPPKAAAVNDLPIRLKALSGTETRWTVCAFGPNEHAVSLEAVRLGGHVRVGFENNHLNPEGQLAEDNAANVKRLVEDARCLGRQLSKRRTVQ